MVVLDLTKSEFAQSDIARLFKTSPKTVRHMGKSREQLLQEELNGVLYNIKRPLRVQNPKIDVGVVNFVNYCRLQCIPVSHAYLRKQAIISADNRSAHTFLGLNGRVPKKSHAIKKFAQKTISLSTQRTFRRIPNSPIFDTCLC